MWLMNYITKNSITAPNAVKGNVKNAGKDSIAVSSSGEHKKLKTCMPYGVASVPPIGQRAVVLPCFRQPHIQRMFFRYLLQMYRYRICMSPFQECKQIFGFYPNHQSWPYQLH